MEWSEKYSVGIRLIDNDHRELFDVVNALAQHVEDDAASIHLSQITERLSRYVKEHFQREEKLMRDYAYPDLAAHHMKHLEFVRVILAIRKIEQDCPEKLDPDKLLLYLSKWLRMHIMQTDRQYLPYLTGDYDTREPANDKESKNSGGAEEATDERFSVNVNIKVSSDDVDTIQKCAIALRHNMKIAESIRSIVQPMSLITTAEALELAEPLLRK
ncbi:MAG: bacteriohemerythrin [Alphaproteobacteria bacterium]